ncbi:MAG: Flagellar biosynthesis protein FlhF [uncultured Sulfurovum sp.]|uniref:Flagellar biosynthesis protein FlhF n=1 Tax=uncultured Sulfurovum sp. TaxID=269237 RepID=A0A6S6U5T9_9BACT|nr:MAG: Flagellar biosynthesis protein FlhF [uncultured Sulfurovum sp.]
MIQETFVASNPTQAYDLAVKKYGTSISLISARQIKYDDGVLRSEITIEVSTEIYTQVSLGKKIINENDVETSTQIKELQAQLTSMKNEIHQEIQNEHKIIAKVKALFIKKGISPHWLESMFRTLVGTDMIENETLLVSYLLEEIDVALKVKEENLTQPKMIMFVGSTGVGKTTTIAKIAARYAYLLEQEYKVALVNLDTFKVGAIEQLNHYSDIMQIEHIVVSDVDAFKETLEKLSNYDVILIDTTGMSPYDTEKFVQTTQFVKNDSARDMEVSLVLPATVKYEDMEDIYQNFSFFNLTSVVITKFDETKHLGSLLNFMLLYNLPMSYFSVGQEVPDDLLVADKEYLLERFIGDIDAG